MNQSLVTGLVVGAVVATAAGAIAGYKMLDSNPGYADEAAS